MMRIDRGAGADRALGTDLLILVGVSLSLFLYHLLTAALSGYGYFIDEFY
jgi:hypothetical protein